MPELWRADFGDVSAGGTGDGSVVCRGVSGIWDHTDDGEVAVFYVPDHRFDDHGLARAAVAGFSDVAGICCGAGAFRVCAAERRVWAGLELAAAAPTFAT